MGDDDKRLQDTGNVVRFQEARKHHVFEGRHEKREKREAETKRRIDEVPALVAQLEKGRLLPADRALFAANLGAMCEDTFGEDRSAQRAGIRALFFDTFGNSNGEASSALKKRKRYIRLPQEVEPARNGEKGYGQYHASGAEYVKLARALVRRNSRLNESRAILRLVKGSSFDSSDNVWDRNRAKQAETIENVLFKVLQKVKPELIRLHEAILEKYGRDDSLLADPKGAEAEDFHSWVPSIVIGEVKQRIAPFLCVPLNLEFADLGPQVDQWLDRRDLVEELTSWLEGIGINPAESSYLDGLRREMTSGGFVEIHAIKSNLVASKSDRIVLEILSSYFGIASSALNSDELLDGILDHIGREKIWLYKRIQSSRSDWFETNSPAAKQDADEFFEQLVAECGSLACAKSTLLEMDKRQAEVALAAETKSRSEEEIIREILEVVAKQKPNPSFQQATEFDLKKVPCSVWLTRPMILMPRLNRLTAEWMVCVGPVPLNYADHCAPEDFDLSSILKEEAHQTLQSLFSHQFGLLLFGAEIEVPDEQVAMAISVNAQGNLYLAFYAKHEPEPEAYPAYLRFPWGDVDGEDALFPALGTQDGLEILLRPARSVREGVYQNELNGEAPALGAISLPGGSIASDIVADLACGDPAQGKGGSKLVSDLREKIVEATRHFERLVADDHAHCEERLRWLELPPDSN